MSEKLNEARLRWHCHRGMLELDMLLIPFFDHEFPHLAADDKKLFQDLLTASDPELYNWFIGAIIPENKSLIPIIERIKKYAQAQD